MTLLEGGSLRDGKREIEEKFFPTWKVSYSMNMYQLFYDVTLRLGLFWKMIVAVL